MKILKKYVIIFCSFLSLILTASAKIPNYTNEALSEASAARSSAKYARSAAQVSQAHDEAQTEIQVLLVKQLDEVRYILYGILTIGIILIFQLLRISSKLREKKTELASLSK